MTLLEFCQAMWREKTRIMEILCGKKFVKNFDKSHQQTDSHMDLAYCLSNFATPSCNKNYNEIHLGQFSQLRKASENYIENITDDKLQL